MEQASESNRVEPDTYPWVLFKLGDNVFGITAELVETMVQVPAVTPVPNVPPHIRGVMNLRGRVLRVVDLRLSLGLPRLQDDMERFLVTLDDRYHEHERWADALIGTVRSGSDFLGERDPSRCGFGRWLDSLETADVVLHGLLERVRAPHDRLHQMAEHLDRARRNGDREEVDRLVADVEGNLLPQIRAHLEATKEAYRAATREVALVLADGRSATAVVVDRVMSVEHLAPVDADVERNAMSGLPENDLVAGMGHRERDDELVLVLDGDLLLA